MNELLRRALIISTGVLLMMSTSASLAFAQAAVGIKISPSVVEDNVKPGDTYKFSLTVMNTSGTDKDFYLQSQDIKGIDEGGQPIFVEPGESTGYEISSWMNIPPGAIHIKSGQSTIIPISLKVPTSASPGAHFGAVFVEDRPNNPGKNGAGVGFNVGTIVSLRIAGDIHEEARLREFSTGKEVYSSANIDFNAKIENLGNVLIQPHGVIQITDMFGKLAGTVEVNNSAASVFPASVRSFPATWKSDAFAFGRYEAIGSFVYGQDGRQTISGVTSFWVLPLKPIMMLLGGILAIVILLYVSIRMYINKKLRQMGASTKGDVNFYAQKYQRSGSKLVVVTLVAFLFAVVFLTLLFFVFA
jgi:hypothetical protein